MLEAQISDLCKSLLTLQTPLGESSREILSAIRVGNPLPSDLLVSEKGMIKRESVEPEDTPADLSWSASEVSQLGNDSGSAVDPWGSENGAWDGRGAERSEDVRNGKSFKSWSEIRARAAESSERLSSAIFFVDGAIAAHGA
eukprot:CAMPEP_0194544332 /NCGR_PEP_ID=MMETSP0253-20130528/87379_1 /TAXON_ID=2966 /ORGANISM="Noctiluca scintillans" /LENGTH=141 /DNA_ID=CAMNT_0039391211 /DNA_START=335 /DNA_END=757 /DNA_ORIENTATION=+